MDSSDFLLRPKLPLILSLSLTEFKIGNSNLIHPNTPRTKFDEFVSDTGIRLSMEKF